MKKFLTTCFYLLLTAAVSAAGFLLPSTLSAYQDKQILAKVEHASMEPLELTYSSSLYDTLRLLCEPHYYVDYPLTGSSRTADEVYEIVLDLISQFEDERIILSNSEYTVTNHTITLQLAIASDHYSYTDIYDANTLPIDVYPSGDEAETESPSSGITTAVVWTCSVYFVSGYWMNFWIDDKSGQAVAFSMYTEQTLLLAESFDKPNLDKFVKKLAKFMGNYYDLPATPLQQSVIQTASPLFDTDTVISEANYTLQLKEDSGKLIQLPLCIRPEYLMLN